MKKKIINYQLKIPFEYNENNIFLRNKELLLHFNKIDQINKLKINKLII